MIAFFRRVFYWAANVLGSLSVVGAIILFIVAGKSDTQRELAAALAVAGLAVALIGRALTTSE
jgi:hypothetical protein